MAGAALGLFNGCNWIRAGECIGLYRGRWVHIRTEQPYRGRNRYVMEVDEFRVVPPCVAGTARPNPAMYPIAMINEAPAWAMNNCQFVAWWTAAEVGLAINGAAVAVAVHAAVDIAPGEELFVDYGKAYGPNRTYERGPAAPHLYKHLAESPASARARMQGILPPANNCYWVW